MHELTVTESLLEISLRHANQADARRITALNIVIGEMASIVDDSVQFYWDIISQDTIAAGARLSFRRIPAEMVCQDCAAVAHPDRDELTCPNCGGIHLRLTTGEEFYLESIEIDT
jgi:hydrogenase nickel incorporation protein HypA/HybF